MKQAAALAALGICLAMFCACSGEEAAPSPAAFEGLTPGMTAEEVEEAWGISFADSLVPSEDGDSESCALEGVALPESGFTAGRGGFIFFEDARAMELSPGLRTVRLSFDAEQTEAFSAHLDSLYGEAAERMIGSENGPYYFWSAPEDDPDVTIRYNPPDTWLGQAVNPETGYFEVIFDYPHVPVSLY